MTTQPPSTLRMLLSRHTRRRELIVAVGGLTLVWPLVARAQQAERMRRVGVLIVTLENDPQSLRRLTAFQQGLDRLGWTVGRNLQIDYRWGVSDDERARTAAAEVLSAAPDVILANSPPSVRAVRQATRTVPIVFVAVVEPVEQGFVASLAHPGGNITGFTSLEPTVAGKWLELLKEIAPGVTRVALIFNPDLAPTARLFARSAAAVAPQFGYETFMAPVHDPAELEAFTARFARKPGGGLILPPDTFTSAHYKLIVELAARHRLPTIYAFRYFAAAGGLVSYGPDVVDQFGRAAGYVDRILRGEKPANLPVQQPTKYELVINLKTAKALGLDVPARLLAQADEVIE